MKIIVIYVFICNDTEFCHLCNQSEICLNLKKCFDHNLI